VQSIARRRPTVTAPAARAGAAVVGGAVLALALAACGDGDPGGSAGGDRLQVVASFYPIAEAATRVGGDRVEVTNLTPAGTEPHDLEISPDQVDSLLDADVVLYLGQGFQPAVADVVDQRDGTSVDLLEGLDLDPGGEAHAHEGEGEGGGHAGEGEEGGEHAGEGGEGGLDPHFWLDPQRMVEAVGLVEDALADAAPDDADAFADRAARYEGELTALDEEMAAGLSDCARDEIVTSHAAFHYLAERYGLTQVPITGLSPEAEADADRLDELTDLVRDRGVTTVFSESLMSPEAAETLAREADVDTAVLNPLEGLTDRQIEQGDDYVSVMRQNLAALQEALGCG
jgi:zinc transport system substrate-binding protein